MRFLHYCADALLFKMPPIDDPMGIDICQVVGSHNDIANTGVLIVFS